MDGLFFVSDRFQPDDCRARSVPAIYFFRAFAEAGGLRSYGTDLVDTHRQSGFLAGRILKGERSANVPVQQSTKVELIINLKTAKALGLMSPVPLLSASGTKRSKYHVARFPLFCPKRRSRE